MYCLTVSHFKSDINTKIISKSCLVAKELDHTSYMWTPGWLFFSSYFEDVKSKNINLKHVSPKQE